MDYVTQRWARGRPHVRVIVHFSLSSHGTRFVTSIQRKIRACFHEPGKACDVAAVKAVTVQKCKPQCAVLFLVVRSVVTCRAIISCVSSVVLCQVAWSTVIRAAPTCVSRNPEMIG